MPYHQVKSSQVLFGALGLLVCIIGTPAQAQPIADTSGNINTVVTQTGQQFEITGGSLSSNGTNLFHSFEQFNLTQGQIANFQSDPSILNILGRITDGNASLIDGLIQVSGSDANIFLMNPAGILFGENARLNLGGSFTATTAWGIGFEGGWFSAYDENNLALLNNTPNQFDFSSNIYGTLINEGTLAVNENQSLTLLGGLVINTGVIQAPGGQISIIAIPDQNVVQIGQTGDLLTLELQTIGQGNPFNNSQTDRNQTALPFTALDFPSLLTADLIDHATTLEVAADDAVQISGAGSVAPATLEWGAAVISGTIDASSPFVSGGDITVLGETISVTHGQIDASGQLGGGNIRIGGDYRGRGSGLNAINTWVDGGSLIAASAISQGAGGRAILWADDTTQFQGRITATGGAQSGHGGFAEVSGKLHLGFSGEVDLSAVNGAIGTLLLDPQNISIVDGNSPDDGLSIFSQHRLESLSGAANIVLQADDNITIADLTNNFLVFQPGGGSITFTADADNNGVGDFIMASGDGIDTSGRDLTITGVNLVLGEIYAAGGVGGDVTLIASGNISSDGITTFGAQGGGQVSLSSTAGQIELTDRISSSSVNGEAGEVFISAYRDVILGSSPSNRQAISSEGSTQGADITVISQTGEIDASQGFLVNQAVNGQSGDIMLDANNDIALGVNDVGVSIVSLGTQRGGNVSITSREGDVSAGTIATVSGALTNDPNTLIQLSDQGTAGNVSISAQNLISLTGSTLGYAIYSTGGDQGGNLNLNSQIGAINITQGSLSSESLNGVAGAVTLNATNGVIAQGIESAGRLQGGGINLQSQNSTVTVNGDLESFSSEGTGGSVSVTATGNVTTRNISTFGPQQSGDVVLTSAQGGITAGNILTESPNGTSGNVTLTASGNITTGDITARGIDSGDISLTSRNGEVNTGELFSSTGNVDVRDINSDALAAIGFSRITLSSEEADAAVAELEAERAQEFSNYFGEDLQAREYTPEEIQRVLTNVERQTGARPVIAYVSAPSSSEQGSTGLEILLFTASGEPIQLTLADVTQAELFQTIEQFRSNLLASFRRGSTSYLEPAQQLYQWIIAPIETELGADAFDNLLFSMDAGLRTLPIAALYDGEQFLIEKYSLGTVPAIGLMSTEYQSLENAQILAMGASNFKTLNPLPAVPAEIKAITDVWDGSSFLNEDFTRQNLISQRQQTPYKIIHLATHAEFNPGTADDSYIQLWDEQLRLSEIDNLGWRNPAVELLVLSACQTALGSAEAEMGFAGLSIASGVRSSVASLWSVDDAGTLALMTNFYNHLQNASVKSEALRQAQLAMIKGDIWIEEGQLSQTNALDSIPLPEELSSLSNNNLSHPYYWAGFSMIGSPW